MYRNHYKNNVKWISAVIQKVVSQLTYLIGIHGVTRYVHESQLKKVVTEQLTFYPCYNANTFIMKNNLKQSNTIEVKATPRKPNRQRFQSCSELNMYCKTNFN